MILVYVVTYLLHLFATQSLVTVCDTGVCDYLLVIFICDPELGYCL